MSFEMAPSIAVGVFTGMATFAIAGAVVFWLRGWLSNLFPPVERPGIYMRLLIFCIWGAFTVLLSVDVRGSTDLSQYILMTLCCISTLAAVGTIRINLGPEAELGQWRYRTPTTWSPVPVTLDEHRRRGIAHDFRKALWSLLALVVGLNSAIILIRLITYRYEEPWFGWILS